MSLRRYYTEPKAPKKPKRFAELRDEDYLRFIRQQPCCVSGVRSGEWIEVPFPGGRTGKVPARIEACHVRTRSVGASDRGNVVPMELSRHREQHRMGMKSFQKKHGICLADLAAEYERTYVRKIR